MCIRDRNNGFWLGVYPGLTGPHLDYILEALHDLVQPQAAAPHRKHELHASGDPA